MGMGKKKQGGGAARQGSPDRYENLGNRRASDRWEATGAAEENKDELEDEMRSVHAELDYSRKDATRHIVQKNPASLRQKLLRNLEGVRKNKAILKSEISSLHSIRSRVSKVSGRLSQTQGALQQPVLAQIQEGADGDCANRCCEVYAATASCAN